jgi:hypothetical protein
LRRTSKWLKAVVCQMAAESNVTNSKFLRYSVENVAGCLSIAKQLVGYQRCNPDPDSGPRHYVHGVRAGDFAGCCGYVAPTLRVLLHLKMLSINDVAGVAGFLTSMFKRQLWLQGLESGQAIRLTDVQPTKNYPYISQNLPK